MSPLPMYRHHGDAGIFQSRGQDGRDDARVVPPQPHLGRQRRMSQDADDLLNHSQRVVRVAQKLAAAVSLGDFIDGAAHVDVDDMRAAVLGPAGGLAQPVGVAAVELHAQRAILRAGGGQLHRAEIFTQNTLGTEQISAGQPHPAARARNQAKRQIAIPRDRRQ
jgi:hypothetical protein